MTLRTVTATHRGSRTVDGAGVHLVRVLSQRDTEQFDPFLMLDSFDSTHPSDYVEGFPTHPHRGIETITYLISGRIEHEDSLGNQGVIGAGDSQWMTAGSGILHQEMPTTSPRMLGFQLWLNLPAAEKMAQPAYLGIAAQDIPIREEPGVRVHVISGRYADAQGVKPRHISATILDVELEAGATVTLPTPPGETAFVFTIEGGAKVGEQSIAPKTAALLSDGDAVTLAAPRDAGARVILFSGKPLHEPIAWGGPIVMNTRLELAQAFEQLQLGTFIRSSAMGV